MTLVAAAEALRELEDRGEIVVKRVAGSSAGAIAACMFASRRPIQSQLAAFRQHEARLVKALSRATPNNFKLAWAFARGTALGSDQPLRDLIATLFVEGFGDEAEDYLSKLRVPVSVVLSDVFKRDRLIEGPDSERPIVDILADSCAIPFVFRNFGDTHGRVDGGVSSNLPSDLVVDYDDPDTVPLAFYFGPPDKLPSEPTNIVRYAEGLLTTAIDAGVRASASVVRRYGGVTIELPNQMEMMQFDKAFDTYLRSSHYGPMKENILSKLERAIAPLNTRWAHKRHAARVTPDAQRIDAAHTNLMRQFPVDVREMATIVMANSLRHPEDPGAQRPDVIYQMQRIEIPKDGRAFGLQVGLPLGADPAASSEFCLVKDSQGHTIAVQNFLVERLQPDHGKLKYNLMFFDDPVEAARGPLTVVSRSFQAGAMKGLANGRDWMRMKSNPWMRSGELSIVLLMPQGFADVEMRDLSEAPRSMEMPARRAAAKAWVQGAAMGPSALINTLSSIGINADLGWTRVGWKAVDVPAEHFAGVLYTLREPTNGRSPKRSV